MKRFSRVIILISITLSSAAPLHARQNHWYSNEKNTYGWQLMTPEEQKAHYVKMRRLTGYNECRQYIEEHDSMMDQRAREKGVSLSVIQQNPCDIMKNRRMLK